MAHIVLLQCRVPEECPQWVADLISECMSEAPDERPTSREIYQKLLAAGGLKPSVSLPAISSV